MKIDISFFKRIDVIVIMVLLILSIVILIVFSSGKSGGIAVITINDTVVKEVDLRAAADEVFQLNENVSFEILDHQIRFINVNCPDKLCENVSYIGKKSQIAVCMPNRTILKIK